MQPESHRAVSPTPCSFSTALSVLTHDIRQPARLNPAVVTNGPQISAAHSKGLDLASIIRTLHSSWSAPHFAHSGTQATVVAPFKDTAGPKAERKNRR